MMGQVTIQTPHGEAVALYIEGNHSRTYLHTEVPPLDRGKGYGKKLAEVAIRDAHTNKMDVIGMCAFIKAYLLRNPNAADRHAVLGSDSVWHLPLGHKTHRV